MKTAKAETGNTRLGTGKNIKPYVKGRIAPSQIKAIHTVVSKLGMDNDAYRDMLQGRYGVKSSKDLSWNQAEELLGSLNSGIRVPGPETSKSFFKSRVLRPASRKYQDLNGRPGFASGAQLRLIDAMFSQVTRAEGEEVIEKALNSFVNRIAHVAGLRMVKSWQVEKIVKALEGMGAIHKFKDE